MSRAYEQGVPLATVRNWLALAGGPDALPGSQDPRIGHAIRRLAGSSAWKEGSAAAGAGGEQL